MFCASDMSNLDWFQKNLNFFEKERRINICEEMQIRLISFRSRRIRLI
jgi:hypothetical protein